MKKLGLKWLSYNYEFPVKTEPQWKDLVQRWYQLDAYAFGLVEASTRWKDSLSTPDLIILASPTASNETDKLFAEKGAFSPAHFAHTLPNIRCSPLCQVMKWSGPVLCVQRDPSSQIQGLKEGFELLGQEFPVIWILSVFKRSDQYSAHCFQLSESTENLEFQKTNALDANKRKSDKDLHNFLSTGAKSSVFDFGAYEIKRRGLS